LKAELVLDIKQILGESPVYNVNKKLLIWADIMGKTICFYNPENGNYTSTKFEQPVCNIALCEDESYLIALIDGLYFWDELSPPHRIGSPKGYDANIRFNDGKCDVGGRLIIGTCSEESGQASLYGFAGGNWATLLSGLSISNGIAWSMDNKKMFYIDSPTKKVWSFDYNIETGEIKNKKIAISLKDEAGVPDGMAIDSEGTLWIAKWGGYMVSRWNPVNGQHIESIEIPAPNVTACAFGGKNMKTLYVTTASIDLSANTLKKYPHSGGLFKIETETEGLPFYRFKRK
jgi:sugar lactone lactonase YvrE